MEPLDGSCSCQWQRLYQHLRRHAVPLRHQEMKAPLAIVLVGLAGTLQAQPPTAELEREIAAQRRLLMDWGGLTRYGSENTELRLPAGVDRVVFLGDEITESWGQG